MKFRLFVCIALMLALSTWAAAGTITEGSDVGQTLITAGLVPAGTTQIFGSTSSDADLWKFTWGGGDFYANSVGTLYSNGSTDAQLFLFTSTGMGVQGNDDGIQYAGPAYLQVSNLAAGVYFIAISAYDYDPYDASGNLIFQSYPYEPLYGPYSGAGALDHWGGYSYAAGGSYTINFAQATNCTSNVDCEQIPNPTVPEPGSMMLLGSGLFALAGTLRKKLRK